MMKQLNVIGAIPYKFCKEFCHLIKNGNLPAIQTAGRILGKQLPDKSVIIPVPGCKGKAEYTLDMAKHICRTGATLHNKRSFILKALKCQPHPSLCEQKKSGGAIDAIDIKMSIIPDQLPILKDLAEKGFAFVLVDNVVDTGKTARACIDAIHHAVNKDVEIFVMAIGDTGVHNILCENKPVMFQ